jgi:SAM-dependent methyltransferase
MPRPVHIVKESGMRRTKEKTPDEAYVHGYSPREAERLVDQAEVLTELLHHDTCYPAGARVLEAGCGVGAQTIPLARRSPGALFTSVDTSESSLATARRRITAAGLSNVTFRKADINDLPCADGFFDHIFVCFVLEHLQDPVRALTSLRRVVRDGGTITVIEGDHGSAFFHPDSAYARRTIDCLVALQRRAGGNALIGRELYPLLASAGYGNVRVSPRMVYADPSLPTVVEGFTRRTFTAMVEGVSKEAAGSGMISGDDWKRGIADLHRTAGDDGVFCYTFFKAVAQKE